MTNESISIDLGDVNGIPGPDGSTETQPEAAAAARRGRPPGRASARPAAREPVRTEAVREIPRGLKRVRRDQTDQFDFPQSIIPEGWSYQWCAVSVYNNADVVRSKSMGYYENHWRAVMHERHPGVFAPPGTTGPIIRDGMCLQERPKYLTDEAKAEQVIAAKTQLRAQTESTMGRLAKHLGPGMEAPNAYQRGRFQTDQAKIQIDRSMDIPPPGGYQPADDSVA